MPKIAVKCPKCNNSKITSTSHKYFRHCGISWPIDASTIIATGYSPLATSKELVKPVPKAPGTGVLEPRGDVGSVAGPQPPKPGAGTTEPFSDEEGARKTVKETYPKVLKIRPEDIVTMGDKILKIKWRDEK